jgi:class 3 adenylate cyclase
MPQVAGDALEAGREAARRHLWRDAFELLNQADASDHLSPEDLEGLAEAAWWTGRLDDCIAARERAYAAFVDAGNDRAAARVAMDVGKDYFAKGASSVGGGWIKRADRLLVDEEECGEHGWLARLHGVIAFEGMGDFDQALAHARRALEIANRFGDRDLQAVALHDQGRALVARGEVSEGLALLDEATVAAVAGELGPMATGIVYCNMISTCEQLADYRRAGEWTEASKRWCERQAIAGFPGICRVHRAEVLRLRGSWPEAEQEARRACDELQGFNLEAASAGFYEVGELRLRVGDLAAAEEAFRQAAELGREPQPGMALLRLAEGKLDAAVRCIERGLADESHDLARARLLPTAVELRITSGDLDSARSGAEELEKVAEKYATTALQARAAAAQGRVELAEGSAAGAVRSLRNGLRLWREVDAPYEVARTRVALAQAHRAEGDEETAARELSSARSAFEQLGALPDERRVAELAGSDGRRTAPKPTEVRATRTFMFTDIVGSTTLLEAIGDEAWGDLVRWHDNALRSLFARHQGQEVDHAGDGFFVAFGRPDDAVDCAVAIQRTLARHRREAGFAPQIRIGLHSAEAAASGSGYKGKGVHAAARIGSLAGAGEIVASESTLRAARKSFAASPRREVSVKGVSEPVHVVSLEWR